MQRLADAQPGGDRLRAPAAYLTPGPLWAAFDWTGALGRFASVCMPRPDWMDDTPHQQAQQRAQPADDKVVVLLDEIDKADPDLPNALLEVLANDGFTVSVPGADRVACNAGQRPLIVITTNEERELPPAFMRRCFVITLALPDAGNLKSHMVDLAERHQRYLVKCKLRDAAQQCTKQVLELAADCLVAARLDAQAKQEYVPATAEYLDLVRALATLYPRDPATQMAQLEELKTYALYKTLGGGS